LHHALGLLHQVQRLVRQLLLPTRRYVDVAALGVGVGAGVELGGLGGVEVDPHVVQ